MTSGDEPVIPDMTAAELALGVLDGEERADALRRVLAEPAFAREVDWWRTHLSALYAFVPAVEPSAELGRRVRRIPDLSARSSRRWAWTAGASALAASGLLALLLTRPPAAPVPPPVTASVAAPVSAPVSALVAVLQPARGEPFSALYDASRRQLRLGGMVTVPGGRDAELWAIGRDGVPRALGILRQRGAGVATLTVSNSLTLDAGTTLAISIEPTGGSPGPGPSGPVTASGKIVQL